MSRGGLLETTAAVLYDLAPWLYLPMAVGAVAATMTGRRRLGALLLAATALVILGTIALGVLAMIQAGGFD